jgi:hypothetical protein
MMRKMMRKTGTSTFLDEVELAFRRYPRHIYHQLYAEAPACCMIQRSRVHRWNHVDR